MKTCKFILLFVLLVSCWNCMEPGLGIEEEVFSDTELNLFSENIRVMDLLVSGYPSHWGDATFTILNSSIGSILLKYVKALNPNSAFIRFEAILDEDGNPDMSKEEMAYAGNGLIRYTGKVLNNDTKDELLFHEFFHIFQNGIERPPIKSVNNELEACLAQYFYSDNKTDSYFAVVIHPDFRKTLVSLASCIDKYTGDLKEGISYDEFHEKYVAALNFIAGKPPYNSSDWIRDQAEYNEHPFPKLIQLLKQQS